jgi:hypothetical protein
VVGDVIRAVGKNEGGLTGGATVGVVLSPKENAGLAGVAAAETSGFGADANGGGGGALVEVLEKMDGIFERAVAAGGAAGATTVVGFGGKLPQPDGAAVFGS